MELRKTSVRQAVEAVYNRELTAHKLIEQTLKNCSILNETMNIFTHIAGIDALEQAKAVDRKIENGAQLPLAGVPVAVKDDICYGVLPTSFGSAAFKEFISPYTATAVEKLMDAGAIVVGKTNLDDMSQGSTTLSSPFGPTLNPWLAERAAGSAGAAALATGVCMLSLESDNGGALRQGASDCGVIGLRPTAGRISNYGLNTFTSSFGQVGISAFSSENISCAFEIISGFDERDASTAVCRDRSTEKHAVADIEKIKIGYPVNAFDYLEPGLREVYEKTRDEYAARGFMFEEIDLTLLREALQAYYIISAAEASSNHARFDGIRFGKAGKATDLEELYCKTRGVTLGREARRRSVFGTFLLSKGNYDCYYRQALKVWNMVREEFAAAFGRYDIIVLPAVKSLPRPLDEEKEFIEDWADDLYCAPVSLAGLPSLCLPVGRVGQLPVGMQLIGPPFSDEFLVEICNRVFR